MKPDAITAALDGLTTRLLRLAREQYHPRDGLVNGLAARLGVGPAIGDADFAELASRRGPAQGYQEVAQLALLCHSRPDAVPLFQTGLGRLARREYWTGGCETLAIDALALFALAVGAVDVQRATGGGPDVGWLVDLLRESGRRLSTPARPLLNAALGLLGHPTDAGDAALRAACTLAGLYSGSVGVADVLQDVNSGLLTRVNPARAEWTVIYLAALEWVRRCRG